MEKQKEKKIEDLFARGILASSDLLEKEVEETILQKIESEEDLLVLNTDYLGAISQSTSLVDWYNLDRFRVAAEKDPQDELYQSQLKNIQRSTLTIPNLGQVIKTTSLEVQLDPLTSLATSEEETSYLSPEPSSLSTSTPFELSTSQISVTVIISHKNTPKKYTINDFTQFFLSRYNFLENILRNRQELLHPLMISRLLSKKEPEQVSVIGLVDEIAETKTGNLIVTLEDPTGKIKLIVNKAKKEIFLNAKDLVVDEVIGVFGTSKDGVLFVENIVWPDVPINHELKKGPEEEYVIFLSDIHVGSTLFLKDEFNKFLRWISGEAGNEQQRSIAQKVKYIFIAGDLVDGVGIYPSQEEELEIKDIAGQYQQFANLIRQIPVDKKIIICPGNHDVVHLAEPQPAFYQEFATDLFALPNVTLVTNPSLINVGKRDDFEGFDVLMYHGYSFDYYVANVESIRAGGGYHRADLIMKFLLKRRHLAPSFKSTPYYPSHVEDPLLIKKIPDFFITGHIHYSCVANYKGITMISGSCWQGKTSFQEKLGHEPEPARVPVVNLKTREVKVMRFG